MAFFLCRAESFSEEYYTGSIDIKTTLDNELVINISKSTKELTIFYSKFKCIDSVKVKSDTIDLNGMLGELLKNNRQIDFFKEVDKHFELRREYSIFNNYSLTLSPSNNKSYFELVDQVLNYNKIIEDVLAEKGFINYSGYQQQYKIAVRQNGIVKLDETMRDPLSHYHPLIDELIKETTIVINKFYKKTNANQVDV